MKEIESVEKLRNLPSSERKIVTKETHQGCLSFAITAFFPGGFAPGPFPPPAGGGTPARRATHCLLSPLPGATGEARAGTAAARDQAKENHSAGPGKGAAPIPAAGALGGPRPANYSPPSGDGPGQAKGCPPQPGRQKRPQRPHSRHGGTAKPHGGRPAVLPGPAPRTALSLAGGLRPPRFGRRRKLTGADRRRPTAGPAPHHQAPTTTSPGGQSPAGGRPGQAGQFSCRRIPLVPRTAIRPPQGTRRGAIAPGRDGGRAMRPGLAARTARRYGRSRGHRMAGGGAARGQNP